jgi:twitching motility protein PilT
MNEIVLGLGPQKSLWDIVNLSDAQIRAMHGASRKVIARAGGLEIEAERPRLDGPLLGFTLRLSSLGDLKETIRAGAAKAPIACQFAEANGQLEVRCPPPPEEQAERVREACETVTAPLRLPEIWRVRGEGYRAEPVSPEGIFRAMTRFRASDAHLYPGAPPVFRVDSMIRRSQMTDAVSSEQIFALIREMAPEKEVRALQQRQQCSFIFHQVGLGYARVSAFIKSGVPHCTMRYLPEKIPSFEDLRIPRPTMEQLGRLHFGLILVTGMTGSGKSTTVAALVDWINEHRTVHILTIEEPVEYVHVNKKAMISQRDVGVDVSSFQEAVRGALRHDPDVIVVGEMRDPDTIRSAISAASTGHLVISTLHAGTASEVVNRIVSFFDPVERDLVRLQLRDSLRCVICQRLVPKTGGGRLPALEILINDTKYIADSILAGDTLGIRIGMQQDASASFIFEKYLHDLVKQQLITVEQAQTYATEPSILDQMRLGTYVIPSLDSMLHRSH